MSFKDVIVNVSWHKEPGFKVYSKHVDAKATTFTTNNSNKNFEVQTLNFSSKYVNIIQPSAFNYNESKFLIPVQNTITHRFSVV